VFKVTKWFAADCRAEIIGVVPTLEAAKKLVEEHTPRLAPGETLKISRAIG
jgi:hypothetical protein